MLRKTARPDFSRKSRFAGKKIIVYLTIFSLLNLFGCYYQQQMNPEEYKFDEKADLQVTTKDTVYTIMGEDYYYSNDTVFAKVPIQLDERTSAKQKINIPVKNIEMVEAERENTTGTILIISAAVLVIAGIVYFLSLGLGARGPKF